MTSKKKRIVLLDVHAIVHRAYHALPELTGPSGVPTGALYGLVSMLLKIIADLKPDYLAACYDLPKPTIRHEAYDGYKATRAKTDDALVSQLVASRKIFAAFSIPMYEREGFEADDLLGTIAHELRERGDVDVIIASGDMDTLQLVDNARVRVYTLKRGLSETILYDEKAVRERFGFPPDLLPDWKGLRGDPSDNIPGVPGIGEKIATELVTTFGTIEKMYAALKKSEKQFAAKGIKPRVIELLKVHEEEARFSKSLAIIRCDAPIAFTLPAEPWCVQLDYANVRAVLDTFGFRSLRDRARQLIASVTGGAVEEQDGDRTSTNEQTPPDPQRFKEAAVMLWLISSEFTNPSLDDILAFTKARTFDAAYAALEKQLVGLGRVRVVYEDIEKPLIPVIEKMEQRGITIDTAALHILAKKYRTELEGLEERIYAEAGRSFNVSSPKQLGEVLFDELKLVLGRQKRTAGGARSTRESELEKIRDAHPIIGDILEYRELKKLLSTYIENLPPLLDADSRLHAEFIQTGTTTGRMASQNPNLQNIPHHFERGKAVRRAFGASEDFTLVSIDYSQIELRLAAILSGDEKLCAIFTSGRDVHREVAAYMFNVTPEAVDGEMRRRAKVINFGILYGMGVNALRTQLGSTTAEAHRFLEEYFHTFSTLAAYLEKTKEFARTHGYTETLFGRRRQFPEMKSPLPYVRAQAERMAINAPIQGTQADLIKRAMVAADALVVREHAAQDAYLLLQVHDELVYEIRSERSEVLGTAIKDIMESVLDGHETHGVPIVAAMQCGQNWGEMRAA